MTDLASSPTSAVTNYLAQLQQAMDAAPAQFESASSTGDFAGVLSTLQAAMDPSASSASSSPGSTPASSVSVAPGSTPTPSSVVANALNYLGTPYVWGGTTPSGFDCSGFVQYVYNQVGVSLPRTSEQQATVGTAVDSLADAQPGDLVFFPGTDGTAASPGHVGIYLGNGEMIDAPETGSAVSIQPVGTPVAIRRVLAEDSTPLDTSLSSPDSSSGATPSTGVSVPATLAPALLSAASKYGVPAQLLAAVASQESGFDPDATSSAGAQGVMQLMPDTAAGLGVNPYDPTQAFDGAAQLLSGYIAQYHSIPLALAAYNAGPAAVAQYGGIPPYPQTQQYVSNVLQLAGVSN